MPKTATIATKVNKKVSSRNGTTQPAKKSPVLPKQKTNNLYESNFAEKREFESSFESKLNSSKGKGDQLSANTRDFMESRFGSDFTEVKIHTDSNSVQMNKELNAQAFTHGNDVYFNRGRYDPTSSSGKHWLAHELTMQQNGYKTSKENTASTKIQRFVGLNPEAVHELYLQKYQKERKIFGGLLSDNVARDIVKRWKRGDSKYILTVIHKEFLIKEMMDGDLEDSDQQGILDLLSYSGESDYKKLLPIVDGAINRFSQEKIQRLKKMKNARKRRRVAKGATFDPELVRAAMLKLIKNAGLWNWIFSSQKDCITTIREIVLPQLYKKHPKNMKRIKKEVDTLCRLRGNRIMDVMEGLKKAGFIVGSKKRIPFKRNWEYRLVKGKKQSFKVPKNLRESAWNYIIKRSSKHEGWHIFGMSIMAGYHSVTVFVNNRPGGPFLYWSDQIPRIGTKTFEPGSEYGFRRYKNPHFDKYIELYTREKWDYKRKNHKKQPETHDSKTDLEIWKLKAPT